MVDRHATMALLNNTIRRPRRRDPAEGEVRTDSAKAESNRTKPSGNVLQELDLELDKNPKHKATLHSIMAGSIRPNARITHSHGLKPSCRCGAEKEDVQHVFNHCPDHNHIREKYDEAIQKVARQDGETQEQILKVLQNQALQNCGIMPECEKLVRWQDARNDDEQDAARIPPLETLEEERRQGEWWSEGWLRIFTDGGVANPEDTRIATGGCGIYFGQEHPLNTAAKVEGRKLDSYRAELQAVRLTLSGCRRWKTKIWITLDNSAVVGDINKCIKEGGKMHKEDNNDIWEAITGLIKERAESESIKVTWTKGHATDEDIAKGKASQEERSRNQEADKLATQGIAMNAIDGVMVKAAKQRKTVAALQQTKLVKMWLNRQELAALDLAEQQQLDEEAQAIEEMQEAFNPKGREDPKAGDNEDDPGKKEEGRRPWHYVKIKVPTYQWEKGKASTATSSKRTVCRQHKGRPAKLVVQKCRRQEEQNKIGFPPAFVERSRKLVGKTQMGGQAAGAIKRSHVAGASHGLRDGLGN